MKNYKDFVRAVKHPVRSIETSYQPTIFKVATKDLETFKAFCISHRIDLIDRLDAQLEDLARVNFPSSDLKKERLTFIESLVATTENGAAYGNWCYFPWSQRVIHILEEPHFFSVITNRNQYKITQAEQQRLKKKTIAVVGLSVGGEAAISFAQEHLCGRIKIADYDVLDLSNLNRLNASIEEIGILKTTISARRIHRINPYLKVEVFPEGIHQENMDEFMAGIDLLVEECDGLEIKMPLREKAKSLKINTIYCADERGLLSIEPYHNMPDFPVFHGFLKKAQGARASFANDGAFLKALSVWCGGWDNISERSRASLLEIGKATCGYPQLASEARFAAGQLGNIARRLLLGEEIAPFFDYIDMEELVK
jgi:molybdopterin/thiamine biosynthesis adenylyltransferase